MDPERKVSFKDFVQDAATLGEAAFKAKFSDPLLVFIENGAATANTKLIDTPAHGTELGGDDTGQFSLGTGSYATFEQSLSCVVAIEKTARNPFATMITVGRSLNNDIVLAFPTVSKFHAYFARSSEPTIPWRLVDQNSKNGTFIDAVQIRAMEAQDLYSGRILTFGNDANAVFVLPQALWDFITINKSLV